MSENTHQERKVDASFQLDGIPYAVTRLLGIGAYGAVVQATDTINNREVALKKIPRAFAASTLVKRALREIRILRDIHHENIVSILDMFATQGSQPGDADIYLVLDLMETDLHQIIHSTQKLSEQHNQYFLYQILKGLKVRALVRKGRKSINVLVPSFCGNRPQRHEAEQSSGKCQLPSQDCGFWDVEIGGTMQAAI